jgi:hypothetical protein
MTDDIEIDRMAAREEERCFCSLCSTDGATYRDDVNAPLCDDCAARTLAGCDRCGAEVWAASLVDVVTHRATPTSPADVDRLCPTCAADWYGDGPVSTDGLPDAPAFDGPRYDYGFGPRGLGGGR